MIRPSPRQCHNTFDSKNVKQNYLLLVMLLLLLLNVIECRLKLLHLTKVKVDLGLETMNFSVALVNLVLQTTLPGSVGALSLNLKPNLEIRFEDVNAHYSVGNLPPIIY